MIPEVSAVLYASAPRQRSTAILRSAAELARELGVGVHLRELGEFNRELVPAVADIGRPLIVLDPSAPGSVVEDLAVRVSAPVLVWRGLPRGRAVVAGLGRATSPVLSAASRIARFSGGRLHLLRNVQPIILVSGLVGPLPSVLPPSPEMITAARRYTDATAGGLGEGTAGGVSVHMSISEALLLEADRVRASVIVIGARRRSWCDRLVCGPSPAVQVVDDRARTVLIVPARD